MLTTCTLKFEIFSSVAQSAAKIELLSVWEKSYYINNTVKDYSKGTLTYLC